MAHSSGYDSYGYPTANMAPDILSKSRSGSDHGQPRLSSYGHKEMSHSHGPDKDYGPDYATKGMGYALGSYPRTPEDSSKEGITKEWFYEKGYFQRPLAKNKAPGPPAMDYGSMGPFFNV